MRVEIAGAVGNTESVPVVPSHPGVFNAVLNQDLTVNSSTNPAAVGSFVSLFATGQGQLNPDLMTGQPGPSVAPLPVPQLPASATVDALPVQNLAVAMAPGLVGLLQINIQLPLGLSSGQVEARVTIGTNTAQTGALYLFSRSVTDPLPGGPAMPCHTAETDIPRGLRKLAKLSRGPVGSRPTVVPYGTMKPSPVR